MKKQIIKTFFVGFSAVTFLLTGAAGAADPNADKINAALANKDLSSLQSLLAQGPGVVDEVVKALLKSSQESIKQDPDYTQKKLSLAAGQANQITPPTVPSVCAEMRRVVEAMPASQVGTPLHTAVMQTAQSFANAPVVVAAGRPNLCEESWLQIASLAGEDPLLAQSSVRSLYKGPLYPTPPLEKPERDKPSAD